MELPDYLLTALPVLILIVTLLFLLSHPLEHNAEESRTAKPYTFWGHPKKFFLEKLLSLIFPHLIPFHKLCNPLSHKRADYVSGEENEHKSTLREVRSRMDFFDESIMHFATCFRWNRLIKKGKREDFLVGGTVMIPRQSNILAEWGFKSAGESPRPDFGEDMPVEIEITCPASAIEGSIEYIDGGQGFQKFKTCKLEDLMLSASVPIILYYHGGGYAVGSARDSSPYFICSLSKEKSDRNNKAPPLILASVKYRLAPENPFPAGLIDCLSAGKFFLEHYSNVHICGFSAGGNFASVVGMECVRKYPGKLKSMVAICPTVLPRCNTNSWHMNLKSSTFCPSETLLWGYGSYLQLGEFQDKEGYNMELGKSDLYQLGNIGSVNSMLRLCYPQVEIPKGLGSDKKAPKIFVVTGSADPLRDDGKDLVEALQEEGVKADLFETFGGHGISFILDMKTSNAFIKKWSEVVWP